MNGLARDYSLVGPEGANAIRRGLAEADWYTTPVPRDRMRLLMERTNGPAVRDTALWIVLLVGSGYLAHLSWGGWWMVPTFFVYGTLYGSVSDSRWHECGHRTAFRSGWMNEAVYYLASFMIFREAVSWRWSHVRHHSDTIVVGRDPEIAFPRPIAIHKPLMECFGLTSNPSETKKIVLNTVGRFTAEELEYLPETERHRAVRTARAYVIVWAATVAAAIALRSLEPLLFVVGPSFYGRWLMVAYGVTQHGGLAEDVLDHRLNSRTVHMNRLHRYLYWNMNFHIEHHMFPSVPYHALPALHELVKDDLPPIYSGFGATYREIWRTYRRQSIDPSYFVDRAPLLPDHPNRASVTALSSSLQFARPDANGAASDWIDAGASDTLGHNEVIRFDHGDLTYAIYRLDDGSLHGSDGLCTHGRTHLCDGLVIDGQIECPKHNGRFDIVTGRAVTRPATVSLMIHEVREAAGRIEVRPRRD